MSKSATIDSTLAPIAEKGAAAVLAHIDSYGKNSADNEVRVISDAAFAIGKTIRQGDVYLTRIADLPSDLTPMKLSSENGYQLAPGDTKGSRHCVSARNVKAFTIKSPGVIDGPILDATERFTLSHPEHAWFDLPAGRYKVNYQLDFVKQERNKD